MIENQVLLPGPASELLSDSRIAAGLRADGYPSEPLTTLRGRMSRLHRIHNRIRGRDTLPASLLDFIYASRRECRLTLARYLFDTGEVAGRIRSMLRSTPGIVKNPERPGTEPGERPLDDISGFDRRLAANLMRENSVYWVAGKTSSEINSLVEYPLTTVALAIKPPGSDLEFEVKRAGMRGDRALDALFERDGEEVPHYHRLQGASVGTMLDFEKSASDRFSGLYRRIHIAAPPMSRVLGITSVSNVPCNGGYAQILNYFSNPAAFGDGFDPMTAELRKCVKAFEGNTPRTELDSPVGWSMRFIGATVPNQAWLAGSSSFRLDRTADLLSPGGADLYFREGLNRSFDSDDARRFADELLEEVLGVFTPPEHEPRNYEEYLEASFAVDANRIAANETYLRCMREIGLYWGTLASLGGFSEGESFVPRNVGLKSRWREGRWQAGICFMDHDCLHSPGWSGNIPAAARAIDSLRKDEGWICGSNPKFRSEFMCLQTIYRVSPAVQREGLELFRSFVRQAWVATRSAMENDPDVQAYFDPGYARTLAIRDRVIQTYFESRHDESALQKWRDESTLLLSESLYSPEDAPGFFKSIAHYAQLLERWRFLF